MPPTPTSMRIAASPCEVGGFALPKGSTIFFSPFMTHRFQAFLGAFFRYLGE
jgi:cytochrome P450